MNEDIFVDENEYDFKLVEPPSYSIITFFNDKNETIGKLDWTDGIMKFEGEAEESAKIFFNYIFQLFDEKKGI